MPDQVRSARRPLAARFRLEHLEDRLVPAGLQGNVWNDLNGDGLRGAGESGIAGRTVFVDLNRSGGFDAGEPTQLTAADGSYAFTGLAAGEYAVLEAGAAGWAATNPRGGPLAPGSLVPAAWQSLGLSGGDVSATATSFNDPNLVFAAVRSEVSSGTGGLYRSTDGGATWVEIPAFRDTPVEAVTFGPTGIAYAGTPSGLFKSTDGGASWTELPIPGVTYDHVYTVAAHPTDANTLIVGLNPGNTPYTVWKTTDGGATWIDHTPVGVSGRAPRAIAFDPANPDRVYLGFGGYLQLGALFTSSDGGDSWTRQTAGGNPDAAVLGFAFDGAGGVLAAGGYRFGGQAFGVYRSSNSGATWTSLSDSWALADRYAQSVAVDPNNQSVLVVGTDRGVHRSTDGGLTWAFGVSGTAGATVNQVGFAAGRVLASSLATGVLRSGDGGASFAPSSTGIAEFQTRSVAVNPLNPNELAVAFARLNSGGVLRTTDGGATWAAEPLPATKFAFVRYAPDGRLYAAAGGPTTIAAEGLYRRDAGGIWTAIGPNFGPNFDADLRTLAFHPTDPNVIVVAGTMGHLPGETGSLLKAAIWRSADGGTTWERVHLGVGVTSVTDLEFLPVAGGPVLLATVFDDSNIQNPHDGRVLRSTDGGATWAPSNSGLPTNFQGAGLSVSAQNPSTVYLANGYSYFTGLLFVSTDAGVSWAATRTSNSVDGVAEVLVDPADDRIVYARGGSFGLLSRSADGGATFAPFDQGLDNSAGFEYVPPSAALTYVGGPSPRTLAATLGGVFATNVYSTRPAATVVTLAADETRPGVDFGTAALPGEISGTVFEDTNGDGQFGVEFGRPGWTVYLDANGNDLLDPGEQFRRTTAGGVYRFTGVAAGAYTVRLQLQSGYRQTAPAGGEFAVTLNPGAVAGGKDFGFQVVPAEFRGTKWDDANGNGAQDAGEAGLRGWRVYLDLNASGTLDANEPWTATDDQGRYVLTARDPGSYIVAELPAPYWEQTSPGDGNSRFDAPMGFEPAEGTWRDRDPSTPGVVDLWYDFRARNGYANEITAEQQALFRSATDRWEQATGGKLRFTQNTTAALADVIVIGTGDMAAVGYTSGSGGVAGAGGSYLDGTGSLSNGVVWMDRAENWDYVIGNGYQGLKIDYFSVAMHEVGHAIGLGHALNFPALGQWDVAMAPVISTSDEYTGLSAVDVNEVRRLYGGANAGGGFHAVTVARAEVRGGLDFGARRTAEAIPYADLYLDFGNPHSPVEAGYAQVHQETVYGPYTRYGWTTGAGTIGDRYGWDSGTGSDLLRDYVTTRDATFAADLPNGIYDVTLSLGGAYTNFDQMEVSLEGAVVAVMTPPSGQVDTRTFRVVVQDGQLTLRGRDLGGTGSPYVALNALSVVRVPDTLTVSLSPGSVGEAAGASAATGTVTRTGDLSQALTVSLSSGDTTEATVPTTVTIPAGQASATFAVAAVDDTAADGTQSVTISASAAGHNGGSVGLSVTDNDRVEFASGLFDFGTASSPVASGYTRVANTTTFTATRGYGWVSGSIGATDRNSGTATTRDFNSTADGTFAVAVPNGTYSVTITMGDARAARDRMGVYLEGAPVADVSTRRNQFVTRTFTVTVSDGQLTLRLRDLGGKDRQAVINSLQFTRTGGFQALTVAPSPSSTTGAEPVGETSAARPSSASSARGFAPPGQGQPIRAAWRTVPDCGPETLLPGDDHWLFGGIPIDPLRDGRQGR